MDWWASEVAPSPTAVRKPRCDEGHEEVAPALARTHIDQVYGLSPGEDSPCALWAAQMRLPAQEAIANAALCPRLTGGLGGTAGRLALPGSPRGAARNPVACACLGRPGRRAGRLRGSSQVTNRVSREVGEDYKDRFAFRIAAARASTSSNVLYNAREGRTALSRPKRRSTG